MPSNRPRITAYVQPETFERAEHLAKLQGRSMSEFVEDALNAYVPGRNEWTARQAGYQTMMTLGLTMAMARKVMSDAEMSEVRATATQAAAVLFGALPPRPFHTAENVPDDERQAALFAALSTE